MTSQSLLSWGRYPNHPQTSHSISWRDDTRRALTEVATAHQVTLPYGNGRSYGDACMAVSDHVVHTRALDRFIEVDWTTGVLTAESGVTLEEVLNLAIPHGWFVPVTPGTQKVTLGGATANDVHGKNHHVRGTFGRHVKSLSLIRSDRPALSCSLEENGELFRATVGGLGLTGIIDRVTLQLMPIRSSAIDALIMPFGSLHEFFALSSEYDPKHEYSVAWVDCLARGRATGRGVLMVGDHATDGRLQPSRARKLRVPMAPPITPVNPVTLSLFNSAYYRRHSRSSGRRLIPYDSYFYPLDKIEDWNLIYGRQGFRQYQCVVPNGVAESAVHELLRVIAEAKEGSFLAVLKRFGDIESPGLLSFPMPGLSLALDFPQRPRLDAELFPRLDKIVADAGGRLYPAKDSHMSAIDFQRAYPRWRELETLRDPALNSRLWQRVTAQ